MSIIAQIECIVGKKGSCVFGFHVGENGLDKALEGAMLGFFIRFNFCFHRFVCDPRILVNYLSVRLL